MTLQPTSRTWVTWYESLSDLSLHTTRDNNFWAKLLCTIFVHKMVKNTLSRDMGHIDYLSGMEQDWNKEENHRLNNNNNNIIIKSMVLTKFFAVTWLSPITKPKHTVTLIQLKCRNERQRIWTILTLSIIFTTTTHRWQVYSLCIFYSTAIDAHDFRVVK